MENQSMDLIGEFTGTVFEVGQEARGTKTLLLYSDHMEIPEAGLSIGYDYLREIVGGQPSQISSQANREEMEVIRRFRQVILVRFKDEDRTIRTLILSWKADGIDGLDYCQIVLYRAYAANRVRSKNNGEPCYGIVGY